LANLEDITTLEEGISLEGVAWRGRLWHASEEPISRIIPKDRSRRGVALALLPGRDSRDDMGPGRSSASR